MTEVSSPSSRKVDDFLTSLSQLSQERLKEDRQRQRELQKNIDELQSRSTNYKKSDKFNSTQSSYKLDIQDLKFNRNIDKDDNDEITPKLPKRRDENPPTLPKRKNETPPLPKRKPDSFGLLQPIARKEGKEVKPDTPKKPEKPGKSEKLERPRSNFKPGSFQEMEQRIKSNNSTPLFENVLKSTNLEPKQPPTPKPKPKPKHLTEEPEFLTKFQQLKQTSDKLSSPPPIKPKPKSTTESIDFKNALKPAKPQPRKISETLEFQKKLKEIGGDSSNNKNTLKAPPKVQPKSSKLKSQYEEKDSKELRNQLQKLANKKSKQITPSNSDQTSIKSELEQPPTNSDQIKSTLPKVNDSKLSKKQPPSKTLQKSSSNLEESSFEHKLGAILSRSQTFPQSTSTTLIKNTSPKNKSTSELTHLTKTRAKGPKRKLPKNIQNKETTKPISINPPPQNKDKEIPKQPISKKPPPIKQKPKEIKVKPRVTSEVFI
ncbi:uncharacterized protein KGF55_003572 [Candida pseudojiufengensis]|uniref:uncharacterized protein n=1 Tax=Candida pseudojiufengensis TaxID=497109 RepID=UPI002225051F|nr:uncharacterized protein KGF55_003572 [Candida pseudojiufengensis]KAI5962496.1 hypothetical protein KGF55_003572 [Candida pseudojiufengensis]